MNFASDVPMRSWRLGSMDLALGDGPWMAKVNCSPISLLIPENWCHQHCQCTPWVWVILLMSWSVPELATISSTAQCPHVMHGMHASIHLLRRLGCLRPVRR